MSTFSYADVKYLSHVTTYESANLIREEGFILNNASSYRYDGALSNRNAPRVCFFTASYSYNDLPDISPFPNMTCYKPNKLCPHYGKRMSRVLVESSQVTKQGEYKVFEVCSEVGVSQYYRQLYYFVRADDKQNLEWCYANNLTEYDLFAGPDYDRLIYAENDCLKTPDMSRDRIIVNLAFSEDFKDRLVPYVPFDYLNYVNHWCKPV